MRKLIMAGLTVLAAQAMSSQAWAQRPVGMTAAPVPLEIVAYQSDLVIVGKVLSAGAPQRLQLLIPGDARKVTGTFRKYRIEAVRILREKSPPQPRKSKAATQPADVSAAESGAQTKAATSARALRRIMDVYARYTGPGAPLRKDLPPGLELQEARQFLLVLHKIPEVQAFYLADNTNSRFPATPQWTDRMAKAADVERWHWGKEQGNLQVALIAQDSVLIPRRQKLFIHGAIALRNTSAQDLYVNLNPAQKPLSIAASGPDDKAVHDDFYARPRTLTPGSSPQVRIRPGQIVFVGPSGQSQFGLSFHLPLTAGKWELSAGYHNDQASAGESKSAKKLWTGQVESSPTAVKVQDLSASGPSAPPDKESPEGE